MTPQDYLKAKQKFHTEYEEKLRALDLAWNAINDGKPLPNFIESHTDAVNAIRGWRQLADQAIARLPAHRNFTIREIQEPIEKANIDFDQAALSAWN